MSSQLEKNMRTTTENFVYSFNGAWKSGATMQYRAPECKHRMLPETLGIPEKNNEEWAARFEGIFGLVTGGTMTIKEYLANAAEKRVVCYTTLDAQSVVGPYKNEYVWFFRFDESGEKITDIVEFVDTQAVADILARRAAMEAGQESK